MRIVDVIIAFPTFFLMLILVGIFEANMVFLILILAMTSWTGTARFIRGELLSLKEREFTEAARALGLPSRRIIFRHLIPNALSPVLVSAALMVGGLIPVQRNQCVRAPVRQLLPVPGAGSRRTLSKRSDAKC